MVADSEIGMTAMNSASLPLEENLMSSDQRLKQDVVAALSWAPNVSDADIGVTVTNGVVTLFGHVDSFAQKRSAETAAGGVKGIRGLADEIEVRLPQHRHRGDDEIVAAAVSQLAWDSSVPRDAVAVKVEQGWLTLSGELTWKYEKDAALRAIDGLIGVTGVTDTTTLRQPLNPGDISAKILEAMDRSWFFNPDDVTVVAEGSKVILSGNVRSWHERNIAADIAWAAPGATEVENNLIVV